MAGAQALPVAHGTWSLFTSSMIPSSSHSSRSGDEKTVK